MKRGSRANPNNRGKKMLRNSVLEMSGEMNGVSHSELEWSEPQRALHDKSEPRKT
jgi:hypothetical protein